MAKCTEKKKWCIWEKRYHWKKGEMIGGYSFGLMISLLDEWMKTKVNEEGTMSQIESNVSIEELKGLMYMVVLSV